MTQTGMVHLKTGRTFSAMVKHSPASKKRLKIRRDPCHVMTIISSRSGLGRGSRVSMF